MQWWAAWRVSAAAACRHRRRVLVAPCLRLAPASGLPDLRARGQLGRGCPLMHLAPPPAPARADLLPSADVAGSWAAVNATEGAICIGASAPVGVYVEQYPAAMQFGEAPALGERALLPMRCCGLMRGGLRQQRTGHAAWASYAASAPAPQCSRMHPARRVRAPRATPLHPCLPALMPTSCPGLSHTQPRCATPTATLSCPAARSTPPQSPSWRRRVLWQVATGPSLMPARPRSTLWRTGGC